LIHIREFKTFIELNKYLYSILEKALIDNFNFVFTGGGTPVPFYKFLNESKINLTNGKIFLSDERLNVSLKNTNEYTIINNLKSKNINLINFFTDSNSVNTNSISSEFTKLDYFDFTLLGIGEDGHVASIFPNNINLLNSQKYISLINNSPKPPINRITMTAKCLKKSKKIVYLINGENKRHIFNNLSNKTNLIYENILGLDKTYFLYTNEEI
jgi:6-phosphogluconolactonase